MKKIILRKFWPGTLSAEMENLERLSTSLTNLGFDPEIVEAGSQQESRLERESFFALDLHFEKSRVVDTVSVGAIWNPYDYVEKWGPAGLARLMSHDLYVAANPDSASQYLSLHGRSDASITLLSHTVSINNVAPVATAPRNFATVAYLGIGWDRNRKRGMRHEELIKELVRGDQLHIFGPSKLGDGSRPWAGFKNYQGEIPFDGQSLFQTLSEYGFTLALSSESHLASRIASNRIFEAIASGSIPVVQQGLVFPFCLEGAIAIEPDLPPKRAAEKLSAEIVKITADYETWRSRIAGLQDLLAPSFTLEHQLEQLIEKVASYRNLGSKTFDFLECHALQAIDLESFAEGALATMQLAQQLPPQSESDDLWVVFDLDEGSKRRFLRHEIAAQKELDVIHFNEVRDSNNVDVAFLGLESIETRPASSFALRLSVLRDYLQASGGLRSIGLLLALIHLDSINVTPVLRHGQLRSPMQTKGHLVHLSALFFASDWTAHMPNNRLNFALFERVPEFATLVPKTGEPSTVRFPTLKSVLRELSELRVRQILPGFWRLLMKRLAN